MESTFFEVWDWVSPINKTSAKEMIEQYGLDQKTTGLVFIARDSYGNVVLFQYNKTHPYTMDDFERIKSETNMGSSTTAPPVYEEPPIEDPEPENTPENKIPSGMFSKKEFMLLCGVDKMVAVNTAIINGNPLVKTIHDLLMAAEYIDLADPSTIQMVNMLSTPVCGNILDSNDVERILSGQF